MTSFNPLAGTLLPSAQIQHQAAVTNTRQLRRNQARVRNAAAPADTFEHQVENAEGVASIHDPPHEQQKQRPRSPSKKPAKAKDDEAPHLDVTG